MLSLGVAVLLSHAKIDHVNDVRGLSSWAADQEVVRFDVTVDQVLFVNSLNSGKHLLCDHDDSLDRESAATVVKQIFQRWAKQIDHKNVVQALLTKVVDIGDSSYTV